LNRVYLLENRVFNFVYPYRHLRWFFKLNAKTKIAKASSFGKGVYFTITLGERLTTLSFNSMPIPGRSGTVNLPLTG
jgi:hypothetical protein